MKDSYKTCLANRRFTTTQWTLCLPVDLSQDETVWFNNWKQEAATDTLTSDNIACWGETELEQLLYKPENRGIKEAFFKEEYLTQIREMHSMLRGLIDNFTLRLADSTQTFTVRQDAKEASLRYKDDVYAPLHAELKKLREYLDKARAGNGPYPHWINLLGEQRPPHSLFLQLDRTTPTFKQWPSFKEDFRFFGAFTPEGYNLLDEVQHFITDYNQAFEEARVLTRDKLTPYIAQGIEAEAKRPDYQEWQRKRQEALNVPTPNYWFERIASEITTTSAFGTLLGEGWSASWILTKPRTLGWLLAKRVDQAAQYIYEEYIREMGATPLVSLTWITDIFQAVWPELKSHPAYHKVWEAQECLYNYLYEAEVKLLNVLQIIQERYEGGLPLI